MKPPLIQSARSRKGSALLIILAFVLLLTIITTAFLSKALLEKNVSNASSDQTRTDVFAQGAVDAILSDCQQEIAAGSTINAQTVGSTKVTIYTPASAQAFVPSRTWQSAQITQPNPLPNLLKRSACALTFYPTGAMYGNGNYPNASSYPPSEKTFTAADPNDSTSATSLNGRSYTAARWNKALLLPPPSLYTSSTYSNLTPVSNFVVPDWILVQRDGTNPTVWSNNLWVSGADDVSTTNTNPVVGRYAYTIYDEGGLLDMNVAGYPSTSGPANPPNPTASYIQHFYRSSLATVDLTTLAPMTVSGTTVAPGAVLFPITNVKYMGNTLIDQIVGWRNFATLGVSGTIPSYSLPAYNTQPATNYFQNVQPPNSGSFLHTTVPSTVTSLTNGQSDRKFSSRQQLIDLLMNDISQGSTTTQATMENALQYMGTFSRDLNQPSYVPGTGRPRMTPSAVTVNLGGNTVTDVAASGGNASASDDSNNYINVPFPTTLVQTAFTRNDGTIANVGDPLVKKRFALNRLAWLTFAGPIADDSGNLNPTGNANVATIINTLENTYGLSASFLAQGGPTNIKNYFGLLWASDLNDNNRNKWFYNSHSAADGASFPNNHTATYGGVSKITELGGGNYGMFSGNISGTTGPHDPDFFELIKASILAGSKGKTLNYLSAAQGGSTDPLHPLNVQYTYDCSLDYQVLQIGANIIDQSRIDGYTTEIVFDNGAGNGQYEVRGVENYPYLYRVREGTMTLRQVLPASAPKAAAPDSPSKDGLNEATYTGYNDTGVAALMQVPEIWNPHDVNSPMGYPYPTQFRIVMDTTTPANFLTGGGGTYTSINVIGQDTASGFIPPSTSTVDTYTLLAPLSSTATTTAGGSPVFSVGPNGSGGQLPNTTGTNGYGGELNTLNAANTALTFSIPFTGTVPTTPSMFREPTLLARPNVPTGSNLAIGWTPAAGTDLAVVQNSAGTLCFNGSGFLSDNTNPLNLPTAPAATQPYLGFVLGLYPIEWVRTLPSTASPSPTNNYLYVSTGAAITTTNYYTYRMQYYDPAQSDWVTYDVKYISPKAKWLSTPYTAAGGTAAPGNLVNPTSAGFLQSDSWQSFADPRTNRFGAPGGDNDLYNGNFLASAGVYPSEWLDQNNDILYSDRPDYNQGFIYESYRSGTGNWYLSSAFAPGWSSVGATNFRWGPLEQNTMSSVAQSALRYLGDTAKNVSNAADLPYQTFYYADPDGVVRRAMAGQIPNNSSSIVGTPYGYPMAPATVAAKYDYPGGGTYQGGALIPSSQSSSRPYILKRPFRSVGELGYVFSGTPWKNLDLSNPESGDSPLLDVFCINDTDDPNGLVAGKVNLNTQNVPVLATILAEAYYDDVKPYSTTAKSGSYIGSTDPVLTSGTAYTSAAFYLANWLVTGPESSLGTIGTTGTAATPLMNPRELVGKWVGSGTTSPVDGTLSSNFAGFSNDISSFYNPSGGPGASYFGAWQPRFREAAMRALSAVGETRVWNLMIDVVAQTGRYPTTAANASNFVVEGERRYWVHVAIDRYTGKVLDRQIEEVRQ